MVTYMKVGDLRLSLRATSLIACRKSQRYRNHGILLLRSAELQHQETISNALIRLVASSQSMNETCYQSPTRMSLEPDVLLGASSRLLSRRKSPKARISMSAPSATTVKKLRQSLRKSARMCSMCWMNPSSPRRNQENPRCFTTRCTF